MFNDSIDEVIYNEYMAALKRLVYEYHSIKNGNTYLAGQRQEKMTALMHGGFVPFFQNGYGYLRNKLQMRKLRSLVKPFDRRPTRLDQPNYFSNERIAVYTCIFGKYDLIDEPYIHPNNIDYYIITDQPVPETSAWRQVELDTYDSILRGRSNVEKNRWFKMHPHEVFSGYRYSVYVDGNVTPITDFTELVNRIGRIGVAMFWHSYNNCVYQEAYYNKYSVKKVDNEELERHISFLRAQGMPEDFGMTTCNVIARDHFNPTCKKLMDDWWQEFMTHCRRDQISFPYVVWKNGLAMDDIAKLGVDVWNTDCLIVNNHE